ALSCGCAMTACQQTCRSSSTPLAGGTTWKEIGERRRQRQPRPNWNHGRLATLAALVRGRMGLDVVRATVHPCPQDLGSCEAAVVDIHHPTHGTAGEVEWADVRSRDNLVEVGWLDAYDQVVLEHAAAHLPGDHE